MRLIDVIVGASNRPPSKKIRIIAIFAPLFVFFLFFPSLLFLVPSLILDSWFALSPFLDFLIRAPIGSMLIVIGAMFLLWTIKAQREIGKGTPMPLIATQKLIVQAPYSYCRNPLAFGLMTLYFGISIFIGSVSSLIVVILFLVIILSYIKFIEEKELERRFGDAYTEYKRTTPFLIPHR